MQFTQGRKTQVRIYRIQPSLPLASGFREHTECTRPKPPISGWSRLGKEFMMQLSQSRKTQLCIYHIQPSLPLASGFREHTECTQPEPLASS